MSATLQTRTSRIAEGTTTLSDLLYADTSRPRISEEEWRQLLRAIGSGDQAALRALYERTHALVFTLIMRITRNRATADELTVQVFQDIWRHPSTYDEIGGSVVGSVMKQARSRAIDRSIFEQRKQRIDARMQRGSTEAAQQSVETPEEPTEASEKGGQLQAALESLTAEESQAIEMAFFSELTCAEIARSLNEPASTVKSRIRSGLSKLQLALGGRAEQP